MVRQSLNHSRPAVSVPTRASTPSVDHEHGVWREQHRDLSLVGLKLLERRPDGRFLVGRVLELQHRQRKPVDEQHHVGAPRVLVLRHAELVDRQQVVLRGLVEVDHPRLRAADLAPRLAVLDRHTIDEQSMHGLIAMDQIRALRTCELAEGVFVRLGRQVGIEPRKGISQALCEHHLAVIAALCRRHVRRDVHTVRDPPADALQPAEGGLFDHGFGEGGHADASVMALQNTVKLREPARDGSIFAPIDRAASSLGSPPLK